MDADEKLFDVLDACDAYLEKGDALHAALRAAFFSLAQARYSLGADKVGSLQYDSGVRATMLVSKKDQSSDGVTELSAEDLLAHRGRVKGTALQTETAAAAPSADGSRRDLDSQASEQTRAAHDTVSAEVTDFIQDLADRYGCGDTANSSLAEEASSRHKDPINWFRGGLVAPSLRTAQTEFREAVFCAISLLNQRARLEAALSR